MAKRATKKTPKRRRKPKPAPRKTHTGFPAEIVSTKPYRALRTAYRKLVKRYVDASAKVSVTIPVAIQWLDYDGYGHSEGEVRSYVERPESTYTGYGSRNVSSEELFVTQLDALTRKSEPVRRAFAEIKAMEKRVAAFAKKHKVDARDLKLELSQGITY